MQINQKQKSPKQGPHIVHQATKRKWSDWSECSINCVKVRHRVNCDDIVGEEQKRQSNNKTITADNNIEQPLNKAQQNQQPLKGTQQHTENYEKKSIIIKRTTNLVGEDFLLSRGTGDDDYADDGDEIEADDEETDLCDKVDTSKTFEEIPCTGGLCRISLTQQGAINLLNQVTPATTTPSALNELTQDNNNNNLYQQSAPTRRHHGRHEHYRNKHDNFKSKGSLSQNGPEVDHNQQQQQLVHTSRLGVATTNSQQQPANKYDDTLQLVNNNNRRLLANNHPNANTIEENYAGQYNLEANFPNENSSLPAGSNINNIGQPITRKEAPPETKTASNQPTIWTSKDIWPTRQLGLGSSTSSDGTRIELSPPHLILIQWALLIGIFLAIILMIIILLKKLLSSPSYHWLLAKQMIKSTSNCLGPAATTTSARNSVATTNSTILDNNCCYRLAPPPHHKGYTNNNINNPPFYCANSSALLLAETTSIADQSPSNVKSQICYTCHHNHHLQSNLNLNLNSNRNNQQANCQQSSGQLEGNETTTTTTNTSSSLTSSSQQQAIHCVVDSNGRHANISSFMNTGGRFNTDIVNQTPASLLNQHNQLADPPSYIYASMTQSSDLSQNCFDNNNKQQHHNHDGTNKSINLSDYNNNYDTLNNNNNNNNNNIYSNSLGYDDPANLIPERDKGFILSRDFVVLPPPATKSNNHLNHHQHSSGSNTNTGCNQPIVNNITTNTQSVDRSQTRNKTSPANSINNKAIIAPTVIVNTSTTTTTNNNENKQN